MLNNIYTTKMFGEITYLTSICVTIAQNVMEIW